MALLSNSSKMTLQETAKPADKLSIMNEAIMAVVNIAILHQLIEEICAQNLEDQSRDLRG